MQSPVQFAIGDPSGFTVIEAIIHLDQGFFHLDFVGSRQRDAVFGDIGLILRRIEDDHLCNYINLTVKGTISPG
nr:hypothetical protein [Brevundimonas sp.]